ncbi:MAG: 30S ribosomal protein S4 [Lachnospiraceae bacterium]|nr:30S ribosomal protein S4 [Lachnospiraceae bacterium]
MAVDRTPILKRCRSLDLEPAVLGVNKKSNRRLNRSSRKVSEYGLQLREKQKAKFIYGMLEKPFRNLYDKAERMPGLPGENLMILLELRLDNIVFRMGFARTRREARQIVGHKHVLVNGKCVNIPSYKVSVGDTIEIREKSKSLQRYKDIAEANKGVTAPSWMESSIDTFSGKILEKPLREQIDVPVNDTLIVELYSK